MAFCYNYFLNSLQPDLVWCMIIIIWSVLWNDIHHWIAVFKAQVTAVWISVNLLSDDIFWIARPCVTKLGTMVHHHELECRLKKWCDIFKDKDIMKTCIIKYVGILVSIPPPCVTAVARKRPWSFCQKCRWQVTAKHTCSDMVHSCMVYTECAKMAAVSCGTSHASTVSTPLQWIFKNAL